MRRGSTGDSSGTSPSGSSRSSTHVPGSDGCGSRCGRASPSARARDVRWSLRYALSFWFLITPVIYPLSQVPSGYRTAAELNPLAAPVELIRYGLLGVGRFPPLAIATSIGSIVVVGGLGLLFFNSREASALDNL